MNEEQLPEVQDEPEKPLPIIRVEGTGYITRKDGEVVPFTIQGEG